MKPDDILKITQMVYIATTEGDQPHLRPMTLIWWSGRFWFATGSRDAKVAQIKANPKVEWSLLLPGEGCTGYLKATGAMREETDPAVRRSVADAARFLYNYWKDADDPDFILYEMQPARMRYMQPGADLEEDFLFTVH